jgi:hypothetical protein
MIYGLKKTFAKESFGGFINFQKGQVGKGQKNPCSFFNEKKLLRQNYIGRKKLLSTNTAQFEVVYTGYLDGICTYLHTNISNLVGWLYRFGGHWNGNC